MVFNYPIAQFDLEKFLKQFDLKRHCINGCYLGDITKCYSLIELRSLEGEQVICHVDISSRGFLLNDYRKFNDSSESDEEDAIEEYGKKEWDKLNKLAKRHNWTPNYLMAMVAEEETVFAGVLISLSKDSVIITPGFLTGGSERYEPSFQISENMGMPEVEGFIKNLVDSCLIKGGKSTWRDKLLGLKMPDSITEIKWEGPSIECHGNDIFNNEWTRQKRNNGYCYWVMLFSDYRENVHFFIYIQTDKTNTVESIEFEAVERDPHAGGGCREDCLPKREFDQVGRFLKPLFKVK